MSFFEEILRIFDAQMTKPTLFGWFHILWIVLVILGSLGLCLLHKKKAPNVSDVVLAISVVVALLEIYKQINYSFSYGNGIHFDFQWYAFPFQFCSTPMYVGLLAGIFRKGKLHDALCAYLATFSVFAGVCVTIYPGDVFVGTVGINIQTMICHGSMIVLGVYLFYSGHVKAAFKTLLKAVPVFAVCVALAALMNELANMTGLLERETFNMFFISPHCAPSLPVYSAVQNAIPFPWCLAVYILAFTLAATIILLIAMGVCRLTEKKKVKV
ncbi:MAG: YwaF family protein [Oscillospiraceae bacterium]|nr:YwaF family protein [Oscillospiraceae bacterium]